MVRASVIVPARDAGRTLGRTLAALAAQTLSDPYEVIVADDGSSDDTAEVARAAGVRVVQQAARGPGAARNLGVAESQGELLAFCDADVFPEPNWLAAGLHALEGADLAQGRVLPDPSAELGPFDRTLWILQATGLWEAASLFVTRELFDRVGGFEDWLLPDGETGMFEDTLFGWRACRAGARTRFCAEALAHHAVFARGRREHVAERRRLRFFPLVAARVPELRRHFFYRRLFLNRRSAAFDALVVGVMAAVLLRSPLPLAAGVPYVRMEGRATELAADAVGLASLMQGSARYRSLLL